MKAHRLALFFQKNSYYLDFLFDKFSQDKQKNILEEVELLQNEIIVLYDDCIFIDGKKKVLITNIRGVILDYDGNIFFEINNQNIKTLIIVEGVRFKAYPDEPKYLIIITQNNEEFIIKTDSTQDIIRLKSLLEMCPKIPS